jgi:hypothetical protein
LTEQDILWQSMNQKTYHEEDQTNQKGV